MIKNMITNTSISIRDMIIRNVMVTIKKQFNEYDEPITFYQKFPGYSKFEKEEITKENFHEYEEDIEESADGKDIILSVLDYDNGLFNEIYSSRVIDYLYGTKIPDTIISLIVVYSKDRIKEIISFAIEMNMRYYEGNNTEIKPIDIYNNLYKINRFKESSFLTDNVKMIEIIL